MAIASVLTRIVQRNMLPTPFIANAIQTSAHHIITHLPDRDVDRLGGKCYDVAPHNFSLLLS